MGLSPILEHTWAHNPFIWPHDSIFNITLPAHRLIFSN